MVRAAKSSPRWRYMSYYSSVQKTAACVLAQSYVYSC